MQRVRNNLEIPKNPFHLAFNLKSKILVRTIHGPAFLRVHTKGDLRNLKSRAS
jgi:hypothetical protein